jgi:hypothetical protein
MSKVRPCLSANNSLGLQPWVKAQVLSYPRGEVALHGILVLYLCYQNKNNNFFHVFWAKENIAIPSGRSIGYIKQIERLGDIPNSVVDGRGKYSLP